MTTIDPARIDRLLRELDARIGAQLAPILAHPSLQAMERAWRSVARVVYRIQPTDNTQVAILACSKDDLAADVRRTPSGLFGLLYTSVYERGEPRTPYGAVIGDYEFGPGEDDVTTLLGIGRAAAAAIVPFIAGASPALLGDGAERFADVSLSDDLSHRLERDGLERFAALRESPEARFLVLTCPRASLRAAERGPWKLPTLWGPAGWALATRLHGSFVRFGWCPNIVGPDPESGGVVGGTQAEVTLTERREWELSELGLAPLCNVGAHGLRDLAVFYSASTLARPRYFGQSEEGRYAELNYRLGMCQLPYLMITCRVSHYLLVVHRDSTWAIRAERADVERELNLWIGRYVADRSVLNSATRSRRMLRKAQIIIEDTSDAEGWRKLVLKLRPHFKYMGAFFTLGVEARIPKREEP